MEPTRRQRNPGLTAARLTQRYAMVVAALQLGAGLTGFITPASHYSGIAYEPARRLLTFLPGEPSKWWTGLLTVFAAAAVLSILARNQKHARTAFALLCGYWVFWAVIFATSFVQSPTGGPLATWLVLITIVGDSRPVLARMVDK